MKNELFYELLASVQEMDEIAQGIKVAARVTVFLEPEIGQFHEKTGLSQSHYQIDKYK